MPSLVKNYLLIEPFWNRNRDLLTPHRCVQTFNRTILESKRGIDTVKTAIGDF